MFLSANQLLNGKLIFCVRWSLHTAPNTSHVYKFRVERTLRSSRLQMESWLSLWVQQFNRKVLRKNRLRRERVAPVPATKHSAARWKFSNDQDFGDSAKTSRRPLVEWSQIFDRINERPNRKQSIHFHFAVVSLYFTFRCIRSEFPIPSSTRRRQRTVQLD